MKTKLLLSIFFCCILLCAHNRADARLRLVRTAETYSNGTSYVPYDSLTYVYSNYRFGYPLSNSYGWSYSGSFDTSYSWYYVAASSSYYTYYRVIQSYDTHSNMLTMLYQNEDTAHGIWYNLSLTTNTYDANNNITSNMTQYWDTTGGSGGVWLNSNKSLKVYDANNNLTSDTTLYWMAGAWTYSQLNINSYDTHNNLLSSQTQYYAGGTWKNSLKTTYFLNAGYRADSVISYGWDVPSTSWVASSKFVFTYDVSYNILTDTSYLWNTAGANWQYSYLTINTYSGSDMSSTEARLWYASSTSWLNSTLADMTYDGNHNMLTKITKYWKSYLSAYVNELKATNTYNSDNFVTTYTTTSWDTATSSWIQKNFVDAQNRYYYEAYTGLLVNNTSKTSCSLSLYPSPASSYMNVDLKWDNTQEPSVLAIYDMNGKLYKQWQTTPGNSYHASVPVSQLPAGNYILEVQNNKEQTAKQFSIVR